MLAPKNGARAQGGDASSAGTMELPRCAILARPFPVTPYRLAR